MRLRTFVFGSPSRRRANARKLVVESLETRIVFSADPVASLLAGADTCAPVAAVSAPEGEPSLLQAAAEAMGPAYPALIDQVMTLGYASEAPSMPAAPLTAPMEDGPEGEPDPPQDPPVGQTPVITDYQGTPHGGPYTWVFSGYVSYSDLNGMTVELGGLISGVTLPVDSAGYFSYQHTFQPNEVGEVTAQAFTPTNVFSNVESVYVQA